MAQHLSAHEHLAEQWRSLMEEQEANLKKVREAFSGREIPEGAIDLDLHQAEGDIRAAYGKAWLFIVEQAKLNYDVETLREALAQGFD